MTDSGPRLRTVEKYPPPFPLNDFPADFPYLLGKEIVYSLLSKGTDVIEGPEWEAIFARCIGAEWKPSNVGLDDIVLGNCAWGAKTVKNGRPDKVEHVRLISGRNAPQYSFGSNISKKADPNTLGAQVLEIWNERVSSVRRHYKHLRTIVLVKGPGLKCVSVFENDTIRYDPELFSWKWNARDNLEGFNNSTHEHMFTWQPHGSQFTIVESAPKNLLCIEVKSPPPLDREAAMKAIGFDKKWVKVYRRR